MTVFLAILAGVTVFVVGQIIQRFILEPIQDQRRVIAEIAVARVFLANVGPASSPVPEGYVLIGGDEPIPASRLLRSLAARLRASLWTIPFYDLWTRMRIVHPRATILEATSSLISWSNGILGGDGFAARSKVTTLLSLPED
jgi:hypothetical protein